MQGAAGAIIWRQIRQGGKRPFMLAPGQERTYADLAEAVGQWLSAFDATGMTAGERLVIRTADEFAASSAFIAALVDGKVAVNLAPDTPPARLEALVGSVEARLVVHDGAEPLAGLACNPAQTLLAKAHAAQRTGLLARLSGARSAVLPALPAPAAREPHLPQDAAALAYILFTSGTTSAPTGVTISQGNLAANLATIARLFGYGPDTRVFNDMVLAHADGMIQGPVMAAFTGGAVIRAGGFTLPGMEQWLERVRAARATHFITVPTVWAMIDAYAAHDDYFDAPELVSLQSVAAKLPQDLWRRLEARFGHPVASHYGLTETVASALYAGPQAEMGAVATLGKPVDCEARVDPDASGGDGAGELHLRGSNVFPGYWRNPERTNASLTADGWFRTGDLARLRSDGSYEILGRLKNVIMTGGFLIRPDEIDEAMLRHPMVRESVTLGLEDETFGDVAATALVVEGPASEEDLLAHARAELEARKVPRRIMLLPAIPRGISGKAELKAVAALFAAEVPTAPAPVGDDGDLDGQVLTIAAQVFGTRAEALSLATGPGDVSGWDSFSQLNLVLALEEHFAVRIPASRITRIACLRDARDAVRDLLR